jgi:hypothetical protein
MNRKLLTTKAEILTCLFVVLGMTVFAQAEKKTFAL